MCLEIYVGYCVVRTPTIRTIAVLWFEVICTVHRIQRRASVCNPHQISGWSQQR